MAERVKRRRLSLDGKYDVPEANEDIGKPQENPTSKKEQRRSLFVRSLPASVTSDRLTEHFSQSYPLKHATVVLDPNTKVSKGYGFVTFADPEDAQAAAIELNGSVLDGRKIKVEVAEPRHREKNQDGAENKTLSKSAQIKAERERERAETIPPKLIVRNLPWSIKEPEDLALLFRSYGKVKHATVPKRSPKVQSGFGFVVIRGRKNAEKAIAGVNGKEVDGRTLAVDWAVDKATWESLQKKDQEVDDLANGNETFGKENGEINHVESDDNIAEVEEDGESDEEDADEIGFEDEEDIEMKDSSSENETEDQSNVTTVFVRNLPFTCTDEVLQDHFSKLGAVRYARIVMDHKTERSRGTGFVCFFNEDDARNCVKNAPKHQPTPSTSSTDKKKRGEMVAHSVLQDEASDPSGQYTLDGRVLQVSRALSKTEATQRAEEGSSKRDQRDRDKRRLYLLSEGTIPRDSKLYEKLAPTEINMREASAKQRQKLIKSNPSLHLSLTRLSVRNIPRSVTSKDLKALAREAVVGFATDVKAGIRQALSKEELGRSAEAMRVAERLRKEQGKGIVKQAKIVFEGREGTKISEKTGAGRSRGYGFIEYVSHRNALMGLRWLNGRAVKAGASSGGNKPDGGDRTKRIIVEFAIENAQVVARRGEREGKIKREGVRPRLNKRLSDDDHFRGRKTVDSKSKAKEMSGSKKRKRDPENHSKKSFRREENSNNKKTTATTSSPKPPSSPQKEGRPINREDKNKLAMRNRIISRKRMMRKARRPG